MQVIKIALIDQPQRIERERAIRENPGNRYGGEIGDVVTFVIKDISVLFSNYEYDYNVLKFIDEDGIMYK